MSADNYMHILKREDGKYVVTHRFASAYYADEEESPPRDHHGVPQPGWIVPAKTDGPVFDTFKEADDFAHSEWTEYGVSYGFDIERVES